MEKYFEINKSGQDIHCKLYFSSGSPIEKVVLFGHGFAGHKDNGAAHKFADRVLSEFKVTAVLIYDLPGHGDDTQKLTMGNCMAYMSIVIDYIKSELHTEQIYSYATSFGGYLILKYISEFGDPFVKIALRCPAVNMADVLTKTIMNAEELDGILKGKCVQVGFDRKIEVDRRFVAELEEADIQTLDYSEYAHDILILHGTKDEVVPFEADKYFAKRSNIEFIPVEGADHRFQNPACMEAATKKVIEFFGFC